MVHTTSPSAPPSGPLIDTFGRVGSDLRISVTDRCNFRCTYCMPAEGVAWLPKDEILTFEELTRLLRLFVTLGVTSIKVTGGEPTVRADLPTLVRMFREAGPDRDISLTTNGVLLDSLAEPLAVAGVDRATVSCDSLMRHRFAEMTRRDALEKVFRGLRAAEDAGLTPIKINCVVIGGTNDDEVVDFARWARTTGYEVRFIEYMPLDAQHEWERRKVVPARSVLERIGEAFPLVADGGQNLPVYRGEERHAARHRPERDVHERVGRAVPPLWERVGGGRGSGVAEPVDRGAAVESVRPGAAAGARPQRFTSETVTGVRWWTPALLSKFSAVVTVAVAWRNSVGGDVFERRLVFANSVGA